MRKIVIICQGRTGSTNLSDFYKKKYKIKNLGEVFRHKDYVDNPDDLINELSVKQTWIVKLIPIQVLNAAFLSFLKKKYSQKIFNNKMRVIQHVENFKASGTSYSYYIENKEEIFQEAIDICLRIIELSDHHCYLYRKDFVGQIKSLASAFMTNEFGPNREKEKVYVPDEVIIGTRAGMIRTYELIKKIYTQSPSEAVSVESLSIGKKYNSITVKGNFDIIEDYDVEEQVFQVQKRK
jgi:hypothetical protein